VQNMKVILLDYGKMIAQKQYHTLSKLIPLKYRRYHCTVSKSGIGWHVELQFTVITKQKSKADHKQHIPLEAHHIEFP